MSKAEVALEQRRRRAARHVKERNILAINSI